MLIKRTMHYILAKIHKPSHPGLDGLDRKLARHLPDKIGFFIEAGANDGYSQSNTFFLEKVLGWRGILIEGIPELYEKCKKIRGNSLIYNYALVAPDYPSSTVRMHFAGLMSVVDGAFKNQTEEAKHLAEGIAIQHLPKSYSVEVPTRTLTSILDEHKGLPFIDLFSLDVEGYELNVLRGLDLSRYRPKLILVETWCFDEVNNYLLKNDFFLLERLSHHDYLFKDSMC